MKKVKLLLFALGFFALNACQNELVDPKTFKGETLMATEPSTSSGSAMAIGLQPETFTPPTRTRGTTTLDVHDYGATGVDTSDDTDAFQAAIDALPADGGTIWVPAGNYYIKADFKDGNGQLVPGNCIRLRNKMHLKLSPYAKLRQIPTDARVSYVIYAHDVDDVEISGGKIIGDRDLHMGDSTTEHGHGIQLRACKRVTIRDMHFSEFWGDGVCVGGIRQPGTDVQIKSEDVIIDNIVSIGNRRQGLSIGPSQDVQVWDSEFSETGTVDGTAPKCGIDIEAEPGNLADNVLIQNCLFRDNKSGGILLWLRANDVTIKYCEMTGNNAGIISEGPVNTYVAFNEVHNNVNHGVHVKDSTNDITIVQNKFYENKGYPPRSETVKIYGTDSVTAKDLLIRPGATNVTVYTNIYK